MYLAINLLYFRQILFVFDMQDSQQGYLVIPLFRYNTCDSKNSLDIIVNGPCTFLCFPEIYDIQDMQHKLMVVSDLKSGLCIAINNIFHV